MVVYFKLRLFELFYFLSDLYVGRGGYFSLYINIRDVTVNGNIIRLILLVFLML